MIELAFGTNAVFLAGGAGFERADFVFEAKRPRGIDGGHFECLARGDRRRIAGAQFSEQRRETQFGQQIQPVVAGGAVGAQAHVDARL